MSGEILRVSKNEQDRNNLTWIEATVLINATPEVVWKIVAEDFDKNNLFTYNVNKSFYLVKKHGMVGTTRTAVEISGDSFDVEIIAYNVQKKFIEWEIIRADGPIETGIASYTLLRTNGVTKLTFKGGFKMSCILMDWMAKSKFPSGFKAILAGIKLRAEKNIKLQEENVKATINEYGDKIQLKIL